VQRQAPPTLGVIAGDMAGSDGEAAFFICRLKRYVAEAGVKKKNQRDTL